jgi:hypothetical protein
MFQKTLPGWLKKGGARDDDNGYVNLDNDSE